MKKLLQIAFVLFLSIQIQAQQKTIIGMVTSQTDSLPLPGATILVKGTTNGARTDFDGNYKILASKGDILTFSYVGYKTQEKMVEDLEIINILMENDSSTLDEVVITAFGIERAEKSLTYSTETIRGESISSSKTISYEPKSGQLTAGEINDLEQWQGWLKALKSADNKEIQENWKFKLEDNIQISIVDSLKQPVNNILVALYNDKNDLIIKGRTDINGKITLFKDFEFNSKSDFYTIQVIQNDEIIGKKISKNEKNVSFVLQNKSQASSNIDVMFTIDATGSMGDEIDYLKSELKDIIGRLDNSITEKRVALTFYRDHGDAYLVKDFDFNTNIEDVKNFLSQQSAGGGGDYEEAVEEALKVSMSKSWQKVAKSKLLFLLLDAPPHYTETNVSIIKNQIKIAQEKGIKIIPIVASGANKNVEFLMRYFSVSTNGTYVFLTDDSGIGNSHIKPTTDNFKVEKLNDLIVRLIEKYSGV